jgi:hypothetical protein
MLGAGEDFVTEQFQEMLSVGLAVKIVCWSLL